MWRGNLFKTKRLDERHCEVEIPLFDACVGNPPYIRQELLAKGKQTWSDLAKVEWGIKKINQQSNLYVYYLLHTAAFLKDGGRFGYVIFADWMGSGFGEGLQKFLLDHFKILAVIDNQRVRSFETASVNTVILILEKCTNKKQREENTVRFVRVLKDYDEIIGNGNDSSRLRSVIKFRQIIESSTQTTVTDDYIIIARNQKELEDESTVKGKYSNGNWGTKYLRSPDIFNKILEKASDKLISLSIIVDVKYGIKTGANEFFYVVDDTENVKSMTEEEYNLHFGVTRDKHKIDWRMYGWYYSDMTKRHHIMERRFFKPIFKTQKEAVNLDVDKENLQYKVLICNEPKATLRKYKDKIADYIGEAELPKHQIHTRPTCSSRVSVESKRDWFHLGEDLFVGDFIFPSKIGEKFRLIDNREAKIYCDKVNYNIKVRKQYEELSDILFLILNSITFRFFIDLFARQLTGSQTLSDVDVNVVEKTLIIKPELLKGRKRELTSILKSLKNREQGTIYEEVEQADRRALDTIILEALGLNTADVDVLYEEACSYVKRRIKKSDSVATTKVKKKLTYEESVKLVKERFPEIRRYEKLVGNAPKTIYTIPNLNPKFLTDTKSGSSNLFNKYPVFFKDDIKQITVTFINPEQMQLYQWLWNTLQVKDIRLKLPDEPEACQKLLRALDQDFKSYSGQVAGVLKTFRSKANAVSVYKDVVMG
jgi:hypothetical protein